MNAASARDRRRRRATPHPWRTPWCVALGCLLALACDEPAKPQASATPAAPVDGTPSPATRKQPPVAAKDDATLAFCSACHAAVTPDSVPRERWPSVLERMLAITRRLRPDLKAPSLEELTAYYEARAPERLTYPAPPAATEPARFGMLEAAIAPAAHAAGAMHVTLGADARGEPALWISDAVHGEVVEYAVRSKRYRRLAKLSQPARSVRVDLDGDGLDDLVVADLGSFFDDADVRGALVWLRQKRGHAFEVHALLTDVGRVADVAAGDVDGDGDADLVVGMFGRAKPGVFLLRNDGIAAHAPSAFELTQLDARAGCVDVELADLDGDGRPEVVAALAEEHEVVARYRSDAAGAFRMDAIAEAANPGWGSSGLTVADLDADGDLDLLWVNGDVIDSAVVRPHHGVSWIENLGAQGFARHALASLPGAQRAAVADLDGDGDQDVAVASFLPWERLLGREVLGPPRVASLVWLEQTAPHRFEPHALEWDRALHTDVAITDLDRDGVADLLVTELDPRELVDRGTVSNLPLHERPVTLWRGRGPAGAQPP